MKRILMYQFGAPNEKDFEHTIREMGIPHVVFKQEMTDYHADAKFAHTFLEMIHEKEVDVVFSFDYFPLISMLCEMNKKKYISWIFDCPLTTLQSKTIINECNYIYCFDKIYTQKLIRLGAKHCFHFPLGVRVDKMKPVDLEPYRCDCSFLGSLYNEGKNRIRHSTFSNYTNGFIEGLMAAQLEVYGYNFIYEALNDAIVNEISQTCQLSLSDYYICDKKQLVTNALNKELAAREREQVLLRLTKLCDINLYTGSKLDSVLSEKKRIHLCGYADYDLTMPLIFRASKINLNITSRSIESGISLRVLDILSVGGFCITNYQPEIAEYFVDDQEIVMYASMQELEEKLSYYLAHEDERNRIANNGYQKICADFNLETKIRQMIEG